MRSYVFTHTVAHTGTGEARRSAVATLTGVRPLETPVPTGTITRACGGAGCGRKHAGGAPLALSLRLDTGFTDASVTWWRRSAAGDTQLPGSAVSGNMLDVKIPPGQLPSGGEPVTVVAKMTGAGKTGEAVLTVPINGAPYCSAGSNQ